MKRRSFLKTVGGITGTIALQPKELLPAEADASGIVERVAGLPRRVLGRTGQKISMVAFPGLCLVNCKDQAECDAGVRSAFEHGINYFDVAPAYGNGLCETRLGISLQQLQRSQYFLSCKTKMRDSEGARRELERSLGLLKTDHFDLYQTHHLVKPEDVKKALGPGGALETLLKAREQGKVKYLGFSAHTTKAALEALRGFAFDTVMFPINFVEYFNRDFGKDVLALAKERGTAVLAMKAISYGGWPKDAKRTRQWWYRATEEPRDMSLAWRFALSQPGVVAGIPQSFLDLVEKSITAVKSFQPITEPELADLRRMAQGCSSIFEREEKLVAMGLPVDGMPYPHHPHDCECGHWA